MSTPERPMVTIVEGDQPPVTRPMTDEEYAQWLIDQESGAAYALEQARARKDDELQAALAASDHWVTRAAEEGRPLEHDRVLYRQQLRQLKHAIPAAQTVEEIDVIQVPPVPSTVATMAARGA